MIWWAQLNFWLDDDGTMLVRVAAPGAVVVIAVVVAGPGVAAVGVVATIVAAIVTG